MGSKGSSWTNLLAVALNRCARPFQGRSRNVLIGLAAGAAILLVPYFAWQKWGPELTSHKRFGLTAEQIEVTPPPAWIHADVKAEVMRDGSLEKLRILDEQLTVKVADAFALHQWVANVKRVSKHPGPRVVVEVDYRRPVAMVEIVRGGARGLLPIDAESVLLPTDDFSPSRTRNYLRISAGETAPAGLVGTRWGDDRIAGAAKLAALLEGDWRTFGLFRIASLSERDATRRKGDTLFELQSRKGSRVVWGRAPGQETRGEASASEKLAKLVAFVEQNGPFDASASVIEIDLRDGRQATLSGNAPASNSGSAAGAPGRRLVPVEP